MKPPPHLGKDGKQIWEQLVSEFGIADAGGLTLVTTIAECRDRLTEAQALIKRHGAVIATTTGVLRSNPALKVEVDARNGMLAALRMLNLDIRAIARSTGATGRNGHDRRSRQEVCPMTERKKRMRVAAKPALPDAVIEAFKQALRLRTHRE